MIIDYGYYRIKSIFRYRLRALLATSMAKKNTKFANSDRYFFEQVKDLVKAHKLTIVETITSTKVNLTLHSLSNLMKPTKVGWRA